MFPFSFYIPLAPDAHFKNFRTACKRHLLSPCSARYLICGLSRCQPYVLLSLRLYFRPVIFSDPLEYSLPRSNLSFSSRFQLDFGPTASTVIHLKDGCIPGMFSPSKLRSNTDAFFSTFGIVVGEQEDKRCVLSNITFHLF